MRIGQILVVLAWLAFLASLALPAVQVQDVEPYMGWMAAWTTILKIPELFREMASVPVALLGVGNILFVGAPAALLYGEKRLFRILALFYMALFLVGLGFYGEGRAAGYFLWIASLLGISVGFGLLGRRAPYNNHLQSDAASPRA